LFNSGRFTIQKISYFKTLNIINYQAEVFPCGDVAGSKADVARGAMMAVQPIGSMARILLYRMWKLKLAVSGVAEWL
jgi:hypothetical protein